MKNIMLGTTMIISLIALMMSFKVEDTKTVFVDSGRLFNEFELSKKLNKDLEQVLTARKYILDSIYEKMRVLTIELKATNVKDQEKVKYLALLEEEYYVKQQQFEKDNKAATENCMANIWNQLNQYINDYGEQNHYNYVLGANGQGNIMYAQKEKNITEDLIKYINGRYDDKIKK